MSLEKLSRDDMIVGGVGLLAVISLLFFPWFSYSANVAGIRVYSFTLSGTASPDGWLGVLAMLCALAVVVDLGVERFSPGTAVPSIQDSREMTRLVLAGAAAAFIALKFLLNVHFSYFGWGFYFTVVVVGVMLYMTMKARAATAVPPVTTG